MKILIWALALAFSTLALAETTSLKTMEYKANMNETDIQNAVKANAVTASEKDLEVVAGPYQFSLPKGWSALDEMSADKVRNVKLIWNLQDFLKSMDCTQCISIGVDTQDTEASQRSEYKLKPQTVKSGPLTWKTYEFVGKDGIYYANAYATTDKTIHRVNGRVMAKDKKSLKKVFQTVLKSLQIKTQ